MTFDQFQATRKWTDDISKTTGLDVGEGVPGLVYTSDLHIFAWGGGAAPDEYQLVIFGEEEVSADLESLERKLYEFASDEGVFK